MIEKTILYKFNDAGIQTDMFGQIIEKGDTLLVKGHYSTSANTLAVVKKVNKKSIQVDLNKHRLVYGDYVAKPSNHRGYWNPYPKRKWISVIEPTRRIGYDCIKITTDFKDTLIKAGESLVDNHPELFI